MWGKPLDVPWPAMWRPSLGKAPIPCTFQVQLIALPLRRLLHGYLDPAWRRGHRGASRSGPFGSVMPRSWASGACAGGIIVLPVKTRWTGTEYTVVDTEGDQPCGDASGMPKPRL
jgi:hypothetical protein